MSTVHTNTAVLARYGIADLALEFPEMEVPVLSATQVQGDVLLLKITTDHAGRPIGKGVEVVRSEAGGNTHVLNGDGLWEPNARANDPAELVQGWVTVPDGAECFLTHTEEHNVLGIGPGTYEVRRQREFAGEWQRVTD